MTLITQQDIREILPVAKWVTERNQQYEDLVRLINEMGY